MTETIKIEKQVWEATLNRSMVLEAKNGKLKELLKECSPYINHSAISNKFRNSAGYKKDMKLLTKIDKILNEKTS